LLPDHHQASLANHGETLEALIVRRSESQPFFRANEGCKPDNEPTVVRSEAKQLSFPFTPDKQDRILVTSDNLRTWLCSYGLGSFGMAFSPEDHVTVNKALRVSEGDTIWLSRRRAAPEVCMANSPLLIALT
jgi:aspartyl-tRNA synthetase